MAGKKPETLIKLQVKAGQANPSPPVGPALGQHGLNIMDFCNRFNNESKSVKPGTLLPVVIMVYKDKSFDIQIKTPPASTLLREAANISKGSSNPNTKKVAKVTVEQLEQIAKTKEADLTAASLSAAVRTIAGTARSMGIDVEGEI